MKMFSSENKTNVVVAPKFQDQYKSLDSGILPIDKFPLSIYVKTHETCKSGVLSLTAADNKVTLFSRNDTFTEYSHPGLLLDRTEQDSVYQAFKQNV